MSNSRDSELISSTFLTDKKFWIKRIKFDTPLKYVFLILYFYQLGFFILYIIGIENYFKSILNLLADSVALVLFALTIYIGNKLPQDFQELIFSNENLFKSNQSYIDYKNHVKTKFYSKYELIIPLVFGLFFGTLFYAQIEWSSSSIFLNIYFIIIGLILMILSLISFSALILIIFTFQCLNKLGTKKFPLNISYKELKTGAFESIGKLIISISIPMIAISTLLSILGLLSIFTQKLYLAGYIAIFLGILISCLLTLLLYKNTSHIHKAIVRYKSAVKSVILSKIKIDPNDPQKILDFDEIDKIHNFYYEVDKINDWPYNPTSLKKFAITFATSVLPLMLSFFGLG